MTEDEIRTSYENEILSRALLVKKDDLPRFPLFKALHYGICTLSSLFAAFAVFCSPSFRESDPLPGFFVLALPGILLMAAALFLYFRYPQYFTAREKPPNFFCQTTSLSTSAAPLPLSACSACPSVSSSISTS